MSQLQVTGEAKVRDIQGPVVANSGVITALDGDASQYVRGDGTLADFPTSTGGGSSVSYYLNSSVSQGTIGGVAYRELSKEPIIGAGTDIAISSNGYVASYLTDANDPDVLSIPGGNFNCEFYFSVNNNTGNPFFYAELYKYDGTTFTLLGSSVGVPEYINQGTIIAPYYFAIPVPTSALALTDRLAIRIYVNVDGRTVTLHTENGHLCQVVTTLSKGMVSLNNLTDQSQFITTGTSGTDFTIASTGDTHTFNLPVASATNTGKLSSTDWSTFNNKQAALSFTAPLVNTSNTISIPAATSLVDGYLDNLDWTNFNTAYNNMIVSAAVTGTTTKTLTLTQQDAGTITASWTDDNTDAVTSVFGRTGAVVATSGDYNTSQVTENTNLYFTDARSRAALSFTAGSGAYNSTTGVITIPTNNNQITNGSNFITLTSLSGGTGISYNNTTGVITNSAPDQTVSLTAGAGISISGSYPSFTIASTITQYTDALARAALSFTAGSGAYNSTTGVITIPTNNNQITNGSNFITLTSLSAGAGISYNNTTGAISSTITQYTDALARAAISLTTTGTSGAATYNSTTGVFNIPQYQSVLTNPVTGTGASGYVAFWDSTNSITGESNLYWDATNNRLGIGISNPRVSFDVEGGILTRYTASTLSNKLSGLYAQSGSNIESAFGFLIQDGFSFQGSWDGNNDMFSVRAATIDGSLGTLVASITTAGVGFFASNLTATNYIANLGNNSRVFTTTGATTGYQYGDMINTSGRIVWGVEGSTAGTIGTDTLAYASVIQSATDTALQLGVNGLIKATFTGAGIGLGTKSPAGSSVTIQYADGVRNRNATSSRYRSDWLVTSTKTLFNSYDDTAAAYIGMELNSSFTYFNAIGGTGNVAIGTSTDAGFKLDVNGSSRITGSITVTGIYRDYQGEALIQTSGTINEIGTTAVSRSFRVLTGATTALTIGTDQVANFTGTVQATRFAIGGTPFINVGYTFKGTLNGNNDTWGAYQGALTHAPIANNALAVGYQAGGTINKGTYTGLSYRGFQQDAISTTGSGTIATAYGVYIDALSGATAVYSAYFAQTVMIGTTTPLTGGGTLQVNGNVNINGLFQINGVTIGGGGGSGVTGSGTANYITKWTGSSTLSNSVLFENASNIAIGNTAVIAKLNVYGVGGGSGSNSNLMLTTGNNSDYFGNNQIVLAYSNTVGQYAHAIKSRHNSASFQGNAIDFYTWKHGDSLDTIAGQYIMTMQGNGAVGIGETNPSLTPGTGFGGLVIKNSTYLQLRLSSLGSESAGIEFKPNAGNAYEIQANSNSQWFVYDRTNSQYRLNIFSNGNVVLGGNTDNGYKLQISGSASFAYGFLSVFRGSSSPNDILVGNDGNRFYIGGNTYVAGTLTTTSNISVTGSVTATGGFFDTSDSRLKIIVKDYEQPKGIENVAARMYVKNSRKELGYFAQDLQEILPSAVIEGEDGFLTLSYSQVHTAKIAYLEKEISELKELIKTLL
jgi:hypothetical protein